MIWKNHRPQEAAPHDNNLDLLESNLPNPYMVELLSMLERALNYGHTGSTRVLSRQLMDYTWISLGCVYDGFPTLSRKLVAFEHLTDRRFLIPEASWPRDRATRRPLTSTRGVLEKTYGPEFYSVCSFSLFFSRSCKVN